MENIDILKKSLGKPKYKLKNANVFVSTEGYHYTNYLDHQYGSNNFDYINITNDDICYIENKLQQNREKYENQFNTVSKLIPNKEKKILDIGCGGGYFLAMFKNDAEKVMGIEINPIRVKYANIKYGMKPIQLPIEHDFWKENYADYFDIVTLWDVIEHVNYPFSTLSCAVKVLKKGGYLLIDTPCRDSFYHKFGEITYKATQGKFPTFLNIMYSNHQFGHKQIFSTSEMVNLFEQVGLNVVDLKKNHELSFPYSFYLKKLFKFNFIVKTMLPAVHVLLYIFPIKNKMFIVGQKI